METGQTAAEVARLAIEGRIVPDDAAHPMVFSGTCLSCGRGSMSPGCVATNQGPRAQRLRDRGLSEKVVDLLVNASPADWRQIEGVSDKDVRKLNAIADDRARVIEGVTASAR